MRSKKIIIPSILIIVISIVLIYLSVPTDLNFDADDIESLTINLDDYASNKTVHYKKEITENDDIAKVIDQLNGISYKKISYGFDLEAIGNTGFHVEIKNKDGKIRIITIYYDDTVKVHSNGRYRIQKGIAGQIHEELVSLLKIT